MSRIVDYYMTPDGHCPAKEFINSLLPKERRKIMWVLQLLERLDYVPVEYFKKLTGTQEIWEVRIQTTGNAYRIFSFFFQGNTVVLANAYSKKTRKTDAAEIARAERIREDYLLRHRRT